MKKFSQTNTTLAISEPLVSEMGYLGDSIAYQQILVGSYHLPPSIDKYSAVFIKVLARQEGIINPPKAEITTNNFCSGWRKMKEATLSGISGIHFSYIKAYA